MKPDESAYFALLPQTVSFFLILSSVFHHIWDLHSHLLHITSVIFVFPPTSIWSQMSRSTNQVFFYCTLGIIAQGQVMIRKMVCLNKIKILFKIHLGEQCV